MNLLEEIRAEIESFDPNFWDKLDLIDSPIRQHPLNRLVNDLEVVESIVVTEKSYGYKLANSILHAKKKHPEFFEEKWKVVLQTKDNFGNSVGACAEFRCLDILERSGLSVQYLKAGTDPTPDFKVSDKYGNDFYIEVTTPRIKETAEIILTEFHEVNAKLFDENGQFKPKYVLYRPWTEGSKEHILCDLWKRTLGNKINETQIRHNKTNILWINFEDSQLELPKKNIMPYTSDIYRDFYQTGCFGIWQLFFGKKDTKFFDESTWLKYYHRIHNTKAEYDGVFRAGSQWSGVIFNLNKCQTFFQNPWIEDKINSSILESIVRIDCFDLESSWVDTDNEELIRRIDSKVGEIEMIHNLLEKSNANEL